MLRFKHVKPGLSDGNDPSTNIDPVVIEITDITSHGKNEYESTATLQPRKCKVHQAHIEGMSYVCPSCKSNFCMVCIENVLLPEGRCMICNAPLDIDQKIRALIDISIKADRLPNNSVIHGETVTMLTPEIWKRFEELQLDHDIIEEVIGTLKNIPPAKRLKYLDTFFNETDMHKDLE